MIWNEIERVTFGRDCCKVISLSVERNLFGCTWDLDEYENTPLSFLFRWSNPFNSFHTSVLGLASLGSCTGSESSIDMCDRSSSDGGGDEWDRRKNSDFASNDGY